MDWFSENLGINLNLAQMASRVEDDESTENKGSMWVLDQKLDQPMDEEAGRLRNMYREKVPCNLTFFLLSPVT